jgi:hypothetical protein
VKVNTFALLTLLEVLKAMFRYCDSEIAICNKLDLAVRLPKAFFQKGKENNADTEKIMSKSVENYDS